MLLVLVLLFVQKYVSKFRSTTGYLNPIYHVCPFVSFMSYVYSCSSTPKLSYSIPFDWL